MSDVLPLPGVSELESAGRGLLRLLKYADIEHDKRATLSRRLESLIRRANELQNLPELTSQLLEIQKQFEVVDTSKSRLGIRVAQRKLAIWDELKAKLDETMEINLLDLLVQTRKEAYAPTNEHKIIPSYKITNEVKVPMGTIDDFGARYHFPVAKILKKTVRAGRFMKRSVAYLTFAADLDCITHQLVEDELKPLFQLQHMNVAKFLGVTQGHSGLNGIVVIMDGIDIYDFIPGTHSGAVWSKFIGGFEDFAEWVPEWRCAERISVTPGGHVTIFPGRSGRISTRLDQFKYQAPGPDSAEGLIMWIYGYNYQLVSSIRRRTFIDSLVNLGLGFTALQIMKLAAVCGLFPPDFSGYDVTFSSSTFPCCDPEVGGFIWGCSHKGERIQYKGFGRSRHVQDKDLHGKSLFRPYDLSYSETPDGAHWLTYTFSNMDRFLFTYGLHGHLTCQRCLSQPFQFCWEDIFTEGQEISQCLNADLDNIHFISSIRCLVCLGRPQEASWDEIPRTLYYHRNSRSTKPHEVQGFYSTSKTPDSGAWQGQLENQGW
ncbi:hypothetical protein BDV93DRAFT_523906 [Ceratobasidium sp. AG-I]|nr:hypothetical protein BDV93DRAFT_523906 [Ceratobasidium sp. AG-I]